MSGPGDDDGGERVRRRGAVPPPPDESPDSVHLPRMEPPPASLEAMVRSRPRGAPEPEASSSWWLWVALVLAAVVITGYVMR